MAVKETRPLIEELCLIIFSERCPSASSGVEYPEIMLFETLNSPKTSSRRSVFQQFHTFESSLEKVRHLESDEFDAALS